MTNKFDFKIWPVSPAFNKNGAPAQALPNYVLDTPTTDRLLDVKSTLQALASPENAAFNRQKIYPKNIEDYLLNPVKKEHRTMFDIVEGKWAKGYGLAVLRVEDGGRPTYLYAIEDQRLKKMAVLGDADLGTAFCASLAKDGLTYVCKDDPDASRMIDDFLAEGVSARARKRKARAIAGETNGMIESLVKCFATVCGPEMGRDIVIPKETTVGEAMKESRMQPWAYVSIVKPKL